MSSGPDVLVGEAARGVVELHRRDAEVREDEIRAGDAFRGQHLRQPGEVAAMRAEDRLAEPERAQALDRSRQLDRIDVQADQPAAGLNALEDRPRVPAEAERAIDRDLARLPAPAPRAPRPP